MLRISSHSCTTKVKDKTKITRDVVQEASFQIAFSCVNTILWLKKIVKMI